MISHACIETHLRDISGAQILSLHFVVQVLKQPLFKCSLRVLCYTSKSINVFQNIVLFEQEEIMNNLILLQTEAKAILTVF